MSDNPSSPRGSNRRLLSVGTAKIRFLRVAIAAVVAVAAWLWSLITPSTFTLLAWLITNGWVAWEIVALVTAKRRRVLRPVVGILLALMTFRGFVALVPTVPQPSADPRGSSPSAGSEEFLAGYEAGGWGPGRRTFSAKNPPGFIAMNSITDDPVWGDQRRFVSIWYDQEGHPQAVADVIQACPGDILVAQAYAENNAADNFHTDSAATIHGLTMEAKTRLRADGSAVVSAAWDATNAAPVWSGVTVRCAGAAIRLDILADSGRLISWFVPNQMLSIPSLESGRRISVGARGMDGELPTGFEGEHYVGHLSVQFKVAVSKR